MSYGIRTTVRDAIGYIETRQAFMASALSGGYSSEVGRLPQAWREKLYEDVNNDPNMYVVFSYGTPIAWYTHNGGWVIPAVKYSPTTSRHQNIVRDVAGVAYSENLED